MALILPAHGIRQIDEIWSETLDADSANVGDYSLRQIISSIVGTGPWNEIRVTFQAGAATGLSADNCAVGIRSGSSDDTMATPTELLFSGGSGFSISAGQEITSDWLSFSFTHTDELLVVNDVSSGTQVVRYLGSGADGDYLSAGSNTYNTATVSMSSGGSRAFGVNKVEARK